MFGVYCKEIGALYEMHSYRFRNIARKGVNG